ncbi:DUF6221 family protein [Isoptericola sp. NPDC058082]|uniref:DUF6221 family protein n=1 Tax=Isoptericola sp. NPDC058082 TaxID=3346331 RepID=UPI0036ED84B1
MTLTEFLIARLDEDEARAAAAELRNRHDPGDAPQTNGLGQVSSPARLLAEVESKHLLIRLAYEATGLDMDKDLDRAIDARQDSGIEFVGERMLRALALPYAEHVDYREEWRR